MVDDASSVTTGPTGITDDQKTKGAVAYVFGLITGVIIFVIAGEDKYLKFHGLQAIIYSIAAGIAMFIIMIIGTIISIILSFVTAGIGGCCFSVIILIVMLAIFLYLWYGAYMVYTTGTFRMPVIADFIDKNLLK